MSQTQPASENNPYVRPTWDQYFLEIMRVVGTRSTCDRGRSGSVIVRDKRILTTGYVGSPIGAPHCDEVGHDMRTVTTEDGKQSQHCVRTVHAEQNAIVQAARMGVALEGATIYCKMTPCATCSKLIINAGIKRVVASKDYHAGANSKVAFKDAGVTFELVDPAMETYKNM